MLTLVLAERGEPGLRALAVLRTGAAREANRSYHLASPHDGQSALDGDGAPDPQDARPIIPTSEHVLEGFGWPLESRG